jgi:hypothetical protein
MSSNVAESPDASDNESNNPYDVLRDDDEEEVPTDDDKEEVSTVLDQKELEDESLSNHSARTSPALCYELLLVTKVENNCWEMKIMSSNLHRFYFTNDPDRGALCSSLRLLIPYVSLI